jgi:type IV secretory pathway VirJ component
MRRTALRPGRAGIALLVAALAAAAAGHALARGSDAGANAKDTAPAVGDLPLVEVSARGEGDTLAVIVTGDGGWAALVRDVSGVLSEHGIPVVGLNSMQYFWSRRTPEEAAADLERIVRHATGMWSRPKVMLIGYSRGADTIPFMASRLPADLKERVSLLALLGPAHTVDFQIHFTDWLGGSHRATELEVLPEVRKLKGLHLVCVYGEGESDTICPEMDPALATPIRLTGGHHFGGDYAGIASRLIEESERNPAQ